MPDSEPSLSATATIILFGLIGLIVLLTAAVAWAQIGCLQGRPFQNPDGTADDWRKQKIFYGIAWADLAVACPLSLAGFALVFTHLRLGLFLLFGLSVWLVWASVMTTVTSVRFEHPRITVRWLVVFPFGAVVGLAYIAWMLAHFDVLYG